jgi:hypothetical protein
LCETSNAPVPSGKSWNIREKEETEESFGRGSYSGDAALYHFKIPKMGLSLENT